MNNQFTLSNQQLIDIAYILRQKIDNGLQADGIEIKCLPTYIHPNKDSIPGEATVFDLGEPISALPLYRLTKNLKSSG